MLRSVFSNWLGLLLMGVISVILTPILIHGLGDVYFGMWVLLSSALDYYGLLDLGMRWTLFRYVARFKGANERAALNQVLLTALVGTVAIGLLLVGLTLILVVVLPDFFNVAGPARYRFCWLLVLLGISVAVTLPVYLLGAYLRGLQRFDLYNLALIVSAVLRAGLLVAAMRWGYGVLTVGAVTLAVAVVSLAMHWRLVRWADPEVSLELRQFSLALARELASFSFFSFLNNTGERLRSYTDSIVIGRVLGVRLITPFNVATRLIGYFDSIVSSVHGPLMARMSELDGQSRLGDLQQTFLGGTRVTALLSLFCASLLLFDGQAIIRLWVGLEFLSSYPLVLVLAAGYSVALAQHPCQLVIFARAQYHRILGWWTLAEGVVNILLSIYWAKKYGLLGIALGTAVPLLVVKIFVQPLYALRVVKLTGWEYLTRGLAPPVATCGLFLALCWLAGPTPMSFSFLQLLWRVSWQAGLFGLLSYSLALRDRERMSLRRLGRQLATSLHLIRA